MHLSNSALASDSESGMFSWVKPNPITNSAAPAIKSTPEIVFNVQIISATIIYLKQLFGWQEILFSCKQFS